MSRRDVIIVAVLINVGLLIVLFASALKSGGEDKNIATTEPVTPVVSDLVLSPQGQMGDPAAQLVAPLTAPQQTPVLGTPGELASAPTGFAEELKAPAALEALPLLDPMQAAPSFAATEGPQTADYREVKVKKGDFLDKIARANHTTVPEIMKINHLSSTKLKIGQMLKVPAHGKAVATKARAAESSGHYYIVKSGDTPWSIAHKHHMNVDELLRINHLDKDAARRLKVGDQLRTN